MTYKSSSATINRTMLQQSLRAVATEPRDDASSISSGSSSIGTYTTSTTASTTTANRSVRFSKKVKAKRIIALKDYTAEELSSTWYDDIQLEEIRLANQISFVRFHQQRTKNQASSSDDENNNNDCFRGLEKKCQRFTNQNEIQRLSKLAVLQEQQALNTKLVLTAKRNKKNKIEGAGGSVDSRDPSIRIAYVYSKYSKPCTREAYKVALQDQHDSRTFLKEDLKTVVCQKDHLGESTVCDDRSKALLARRKERMRQRAQQRLASMAA